MLSGTRSPDVNVKSVGGSQQVSIRCEGHVTGDVWDWLPVPSAQVRGALSSVEVVNLCSRRTVDGDPVTVRAKRRTLLPVEHLFKLVKNPSVGHAPDTNSLFCQAYHFCSVLVEGEASDL